MIPLLSVLGTSLYRFTCQDAYVYMRERSDTYLLHREFSLLLKCYLLATTHSGGFNASNASFIGESLPEGEKPCFKIGTFAFKLANFGVKLVTFGLKTVDPSFNRVPTHTHTKDNWWEFHLRFASV